MTEPVHPGTAQVRAIIRVGASPSTDVLIAMATEWEPIGFSGKPYSEDAIFAALAGLETLSGAVSHGP